MSFNSLQNYAKLFLEKTAKKGLKYTEWEDGIVINGDCLDPEVFEFVKKYLNGKKFAEFLWDIPYFVAVKSLNKKVEEWDKIKSSQQEMVDQMFLWTKTWWDLLMPSGALYLFGGSGTYRSHPFFLFLTQAEMREDMDMYLADYISWAKSRGYGSRKRYLYTREELAYFLKAKENSPRVFNVSYLDKLRGYPGFNKQYPALSPYYRRTNIWKDIPELFRNKTHSCEKPLKLMQIPIEVNTNKSEWVLDAFAGSGVSGEAARSLGRKFVLIEKDPANYKIIVNM